MSKSKLYVYAKPNQMVEHDFTDDVAVTYASDIGEAVAKFSEFYAGIHLEDVREVWFNHKGVAILTDY